VVSYCSKLVVKFITGLRTSVVTIRTIYHSVCIPSPGNSRHGDVRTDSEGRTGKFKVHPLPTPAAIAQLRSLRHLRKEMKRIKTERGRDREKERDVQPDSNHVDTGSVVMHPFNSVGNLLNARLQIGQIRRNSYRGPAITAD